MLYLAISIYALSIVIANVAVSVFGPAVTPINAFALIGLDLALRDWLHIRLKPWQMGTLIIAAGALSYVINPATGIIAVASVTAFTVAAACDWLVFAKTNGSWIVRSNSSNLVSSAVDSLIFPTIAFGALMPEIVAMQFLAKFLGGLFWSFALRKYVGK